MLSEGQQPIYFPNVKNKEVPLLKDFVNKYIQQRLPMNWHHEFYYDVLSNEIIQKDDGLFYKNDSGKYNQEVVMISPRFHAKSQCITINYPIWEIYRNPNVRIIIVSANEDIAVSFNRAIINNLENNQEMINDFGFLVPEYPKRWGEKALIVKRDSMEKDPTVAAIGLMGKMISKRADIIIIDDLIDLESSRTERMRKKTLEWFENVLFPILEDNGRIIIAGTSWYKGDVYDSLLENPEFDVRIKLKALLYHEKYLRSFRTGIDSKDGRAKGSGEIRYLPYELHEFPQAIKVQDIFSEEVIKKYNLYTNLKGGVLWPQKWSFEKLMLKKSKMSNSSWMRQYMNEPMSEEEKLFKEKDLQLALKKGGGKGLVASWDNTTLEPEPTYGHLTIAIGVDLAISKKKTSDKTAIAVWGLNDRRERILLYVDSGRWSPDETKQKIIDLYHAFHPVKIRVENVAFQDMLRQELEDDEMPIEGFHTTGAKKYSEETGISHLSMLAEQDKLVIPDSKVNKDYYERVMGLLREMSAYSFDVHPGDVLMASWFAIGALQEFDKKMADNRGFFSTTSLVEHLKKITAARRIVLLGWNPPFFKFAPQSLVYIFRAVEAGKAFFQEDEKFLIFMTRAERSVAYIFEKRTSELVGKVEGNLTALSWVSLMEKAGMFFNTAQLIVDRNSEGEAIYRELQKRNYPKLLCMQPDADGRPTIDEGFKISAANLPIAIDYFKAQVDGLHINISDQSLLNDMGELIGVEEDTLKTSYGTGQRIKTVAMGLWILDNYENREKRVYNEKDIIKRRERKKLNLPYKVFNNKWKSINYGRAK